MADLKGALEARLGIEVRDFAYPVGDRTSAGPREFDLARELGFATAVTTRPGMLFPEHARRLTALPRVSVNGCSPALKFERPAGGSRRVGRGCRCCSGEARRAIAGKLGANPRGGRRRCQVGNGGPANGPALGI